MNKVIVWGGTGNFKVVREIIESMNYSVIALFDNNPALDNPYPEIPFIGGREAFTEWISGQNKNALSCVVAIGGQYGKDRLEIQEFLFGSGIQPLTIQHNTSYISNTASLGEGTQVYAMAAVCAETKTGKACVINTAASVDHDCILGDGVFVGPGARIAGSVQVGDFADIYTGAVVLPRIKIGEGAVVGAGAVLLEDLEPYTVAAGNPARIIKKRNH